MFSTAEDNQPSVEIHVLQGEREMATYNKSLGKFQLTGIPPAPRGIPQIEVAFDIDANGILNVSAKDLGTGKEQKIEIRSGSGLSDDEIKRMVTDAESHAEDDKRQRELAEARNNGENAAYQAERQLKDLGETVDASSKEEIEAGDQGGPRGADLRGRGGHQRPRPRRCSPRSTRSPRRCTSAPRSRPPTPEPTAPLSNGASSTNGAERRGGRRRRRGRGRGEVVDELLRSHQGARGSIRRRLRPSCLRRPRGPPRATTRRRRTDATRPQPDPELSAQPGSPAPDEPGHSAEPGSPADLEELTAKAEKADEYLELAQRTQADFENYRKRAAREAAAAQERGAVKLATELLPAIDNLERALAHVDTTETDGAATDGTDSLIAGIKHVHADVIAALGRAGIESLLAGGRAVRPPAPRGRGPAAGRGRRSPARSSRSTSAATGSARASCARRAWSSPARAAVNLSG